jgi:hypothetical protein
VLEPGETLRDADRAMVVHRRRRAAAALPRFGFVLVVTDRRFVVVRASRWLARPGAVIASWPFDEGYTLGPGSRLLGRVHLVLPDHAVITLRPFGGRSLAHLVAS